MPWHFLPSAWYYVLQFFITGHGRHLYIDLLGRENSQNAELAFVLFNKTRFLTRISCVSDLIDLINAVTLLINTFLLSDMSLSIAFSPPLTLPRQQTVFGESPLPWEQAPAVTLLTPPFLG